MTTWFVCSEEPASADILSSTCVRLVCLMADVLVIWLELVLSG